MNNYSPKNTLQTYYSILGVDKTATHNEIKQAFHAKSLLIHPDRNSSRDAHMKMQELNAAWGVLSDPEKRQRYDNGRCIFEEQMSYNRAQLSTVTQLSMKDNTFLLHGYFFFCLDLYDSVFCEGRMRIAYRNEILKRCESHRFEEFQKELLKFKEKFLGSHSTDDDLWVIYAILVEGLCDVFKGYYSRISDKALEAAKELEEKFLIEICKMNNETKNKCMEDIHAIQAGALVEGQITIDKQNYPVAHHSLIDEINKLSAKIKKLKEPQDATKKNLILQTEKAEVDLAYYRNRTIPVVSIMNLTTERSTKPTAYKKSYDALLKKSLEVADELKEELFDEICKMDNETKEVCMKDLDTIQAGGLVNGQIKIDKQNYPLTNHQLIDQINNLSETIKILKEPRKIAEKADTLYYRNRTIPALHFLTQKSSLNSEKCISATIESEVTNPVFHFFKKVIKYITNELMSCTSTSESSLFYSKYSHNYCMWKGPSFQSIIQKSQEKIVVFKKNK